MKEQNNFEQENDFDKVTQRAQYLQDADAQMSSHSSEYAGFHDYEQSSFMTKQKLLDLCTIYRAFFDGDSSFRSFLKQVQKYAELDPYEHENYEKEIQLVKELPKKIAEMERLLSQQDRSLRREIYKREGSKEFTEGSKETREKISRELLKKSEVLDNRRRALATFSNYFDTMKRGDLSDLEERVDVMYFAEGQTNISEENQLNLKDTLKEFNNKKKLTKPKHLRMQRYKNGTKSNPETVHYINAVGVKLDAKFDMAKEGEDYSGWKAEANENFVDVDMSDAPIFPHEPRMTDVSQAYTGNCYMLSGLQNLARLYPQKIKDMITDNGDGTATVRFYARGTDSTGTKRVFQPVYVRVDKKIPRIEDWGSTDRLSSDCLWVNLIEKAYAMSGLHESHRDVVNLPVDPADPKYADWTPSISGIEGGRSEIFMENVLGLEGACDSLEVPYAPEGYEKGRDIKAQLQDVVNMNKIIHVDQKDPQSITKHAFYQFYKASNGQMDEADFMKLNKFQVLDVCNSVSPKPDENLLDLVYDHLVKRAESFNKRKQKSKNVISGVKTAKFMNETAKNFEDWLKVDYSLYTDEAFKEYQDMLRPFWDGFKEANYTSLGSRNIEAEQEEFFRKISNAIDNGLLVSFGTVEKGDTEVMDAQHSYSIIGAYKSDDVPPELYLRVKNPWTKTSQNNGMEYVNENGMLKQKWVNVKDGIFDVRVKEFARDCNRVYINGGKILANTKHMKTEGYDIITPEDSQAQKNSTVTADKLVDMIKVANDIYDAMVSTDSLFSKDSPEYKELSNGIKEFRHNLAMSGGQSLEELKKLTDPLKKLTKAYEDHVEKLTETSGRQKARKSVCSSIHQMVDSIEKGNNPREDFERGYAKNLVESFYKGKDKKNTDKIDAISDKMYKNKAFRNVVKSVNVCKMNKPTPKMKEEHIEKIQNSLKGRGREKNVNMETMTRVK